MLNAVCRRGVATMLMLLATSALAAGATPGGLDQAGAPDLVSAGPIAFGPEGVLFVADPQGAALYAVEVEVPKGAAEPATLALDGVESRIAALVGIAKDEKVQVTDVAAQPGTGVVYLSVNVVGGTRVRPGLVRVGADGALAKVGLEHVAYAKIQLTNVPSVEAKDRRGGSLRTESITDLNYFEGRVYLAGLGDDEHASKLRAIPFPFQSPDLGTSIEIYHGAHGKYETSAPIRTFVPFVVNGEPTLLATYTCTPLVTIPLSQLKTGDKIRGTTVAELGNRNRPLDIVAYEKGGQQFLLLANSARGVMKIATDALASQEGITSKIDGTAGLAFETLSELQGVEQLDRLNATQAVVLTRTESGLSLRAIALP